MVDRSYAHEREVEARIWRIIFIWRIVISLLIVAGVFGLAMYFEPEANWHACKKMLLWLPMYIAGSYFFFPCTNDPADVYQGWSIEGVGVWHVNRIWKFWYALIFLAPGCFVACTLRDSLRALWRKYVSKVRDDA